MKSFKPDDKGYLRATVQTNSGPRKIRIHILVAYHFIGPRPSNMVLNHKDGNKLNNVPDNLEYVTQRENCIHAARVLGRSVGDRSSWHTKPESRANQRGPNIRTAKLSEDDVREIRRLYPSLSVIAIAEKYGVHRESIYSVIRHKSWSHVI